MFRPAAVFGVLALLACACAPEICDDGVYPGVVQVLNDRLILESLPPEHAQFLFTERSPLLECTSIGFIAFGGGPTDDRFYPNLRELGGIGPDILSAGDLGQGPLVESIDGFNSVVSLRSIGGPVGAVTGFNSVTSIQSLRPDGARITGFNALEEADSFEGDIFTVEGLSSLKRVGILKFTGGGMTDATLPALEEVVGNVTIIGTSIAAFYFPRLMHVGGNVTVHTNHDLVTWRGLAEGARIDGDFTAIFNSPVTNEEIFEAVEATELVVSGTTIVCANGLGPRPDPTCPF